MSTDTNPRACGTLEATTTECVSVGKLDIEHGFEPCDWSSGTARREPKEIITPFVLVTDSAFSIQEAQTLYRSDFQQPCHASI